MALESTNYNYEKFAIVTNLTDFFKSSGKSMAKVKSMYDNIKLLFNLPNNRVTLSVMEKGDIFKYEILSPSIDKTLLGWIIYIPDSRRVDLYTPENSQIPLVQWKGRKPIFKNYSVLFDRAGFDKLFNKIINLT